MSFRISGCRRCGGTLMPDLDGDYTCFQCGHVVIVPLPELNPLRERQLSLYRENAAEGRYSA